MPETVMPKSSSAPSSFRPPRLAYFVEVPLISIRASTTTCIPALSLGEPFTRTSPARIMACAFSRDSASPRSTTSRSSRFFSDFGLDGTAIGNRFLPILLCAAMDDQFREFANRWARAWPYGSQAPPWREIPGLPQTGAIFRARKVPGRLPSVARHLFPLFFPAPRTIPPRQGCRRPPETPSRSFRQSAFRRATFSSSAPPPIAPATTEARISAAVFER